MRAAIYARKSQENEDAIERQIDNARAFAEERGWTVVSVFSDDGISGSMFEDRPGFQQLLTATRAKRTFDVVVTMASHRVGRDVFNLGTALLSIVEEGIRVFFYQTGRELKLDEPIDHVMLSLEGFAAMEYKRSVQKNTIEALLKKHANGYVTGGVPLGYTAVPARDGSDNKEHQIHPEQEKIVVRIFELAAQGKGLTRIVNALHAEGIANPTGKHGTAWSASGIREILQRELYVGVLVYGKSTKRGKKARSGKKAPKERTDASTWVRVEKPALRIITPELWAATQAHRQEKRESYLRSHNGQLQSKPGACRESKYLLGSGLLQCGACGSKMVPVLRNGRNGRSTKTVYECYGRRQRKEQGCPVTAGLPMGLVDQGVVWMLTHDVLTPELLEQALQEQSDLSARAPEQVGAERADALAELARLDGELKRLGDAVATGAAVDTLLAGIKTREAERRDTLARLEHLDGVVKAATADRVTVEELREIVKDWHGYLAQKPEAGQQALRKLLAGPIVVSWQAGGAWSIKGQGKLGRVFEIAHVLVPEEEWTEGEQWNEASDDEIVQYSTAFPLRGTR